MIVLYKFCRHLTGRDKKNLSSPFFKEKLKTEIKNPKLYRTKKKQLSMSVTFLETI
jgi:hypothetical protein